MKKPIEEMSSEERRNSGVLNLRERSEDFVRDLIPSRTFKQELAFFETWLTKGSPNLNQACHQSGMSWKEGRALLEEYPTPAEQWQRFTFLSTTFNDYLKEYRVRQILKRHFIISPRVDGERVPPDPDVLSKFARIIKDLTPSVARRKAFKELEQQIPKMSRAELEKAYEEIFSDPEYFGEPGKEEPNVPSVH